ncbi:MAG: fucose isomerase [Acutalibacteraceae bacterium]
MKKDIIYLPVGVPTFHLESAQAEFEKSVKLLKETDENILVPDEMLLSIDKLEAFIRDKNPALVIVQNVTFANGEYIAQVLRKFDCHVLLWTLREPVIDGGRLRLNSLTGAFSAANMLQSFGRSFTYVFGSPDEQSVKEKISAAIKAVKTREELKNLNLLQVGHTPAGFGFGRALDSEIMTVFGARLVSIESRELIDKAKGFSDDEVIPYIERAEKSIVCLDSIPQKNIFDFARLFKAYDEYIKENNIGALSSRCWPDFFTSFGTPVCAVLSLLNDSGVAAACEADTYGALSMFMAMKLTGKAVFFGDPVSLDEKENTITFWHCGMAPCSLARKDTGAVCGVHCNRKIGPTLDFGCQAESKITILRIGKNASGKFRIFLAGGQALDEPKQFDGTSIVVKTEKPSFEIVERAVKEGWEPHFVVAMGDIKEEIKVLADMLSIEAEDFDD